MHKRIIIRVFTDPTCPFAYSTEPARLKLKWLYGDQINWQNTMIVLSSSPEDNERKHFTPETQSKVLKRISTKYRMPINTEQGERVAVSKPACLAYVSLKLNASEEAADKFLRQARIASMGGRLVDEPEVLNSLLAGLGIDEKSFGTWRSQEEVEEQLDADMADSRRPSDAALVLGDKLSKTPDGKMRYSAPSYRFLSAEDTVFEIPGFWTEPVYEAALANIAPQLSKQPLPDSIEELLAWASEPLATQEVATITGRSFEETKSRLSKVAELDPVGDDGFWSLK